MPHRFLRIFGLGSVLCAIVACSVLVETSEIDAGCGDGMKFCEDKCVSVSEPFYGCTPSACSPCERADHIVNRCDNGDCVFVSCRDGWGCTGCTQPLLTDEDNCGECGHECEEDLGETCSNGVCLGPDAGIGAGGAGGAGG